MAAPRQNKLFGPAKMSKPKKRKSDPGGGADQDWEPGYVPKSKQGQVEKEVGRKPTPMEKYHQKRMKRLGL